MTTDKDSATALAGSPPQVFPDVGSLLWRREFWLSWLEENPGEADLLARAYGRLVRLSSHTGWAEDQVLKRLGCDTSSDEELRKLATERLGLCSLYFKWVESLLGELDLASDKRLIVSGAARFFTAAEEDLDSCEAIMRAGSFSPMEYLRLGEIAQSWQCAIGGLPGHRGARARETQKQNPFIDQSTPHLSPKRLDMLDLDNAHELLGLRTEERMRKHLKHCAACEEAYERRKISRVRRRLSDPGLLSSAI